MSGCLRCHGQKFDPTFKIRPVADDPVKVSIKDKPENKAVERTIERTGTDQNQGCWWCSRQIEAAHCPECGFVICAECYKKAGNPPEGPNQSAPSDQTGGQL